MLKFYMDHHVPSAIIIGLRRLGVDCLTCEEDGTEMFHDDLLLSHAGTMGRILFSLDIDLYNIAKELMRNSQTFSGLVYARQLGVTIGKAIEDLHFIAQAMSEDDIRNNIVRIPL